MQSWQQRVIAVTVATTTTISATAERLSSRGCLVAFSVCFFFNLIFFANHAPLMNDFHNKSKSKEARENEHTWTCRRVSLSLSLHSYLLVERKISNEKKNNENKKEKKISLPSATRRGQFIFKSMCGERHITMCTAISELSPSGGEKHTHSEREKKRKLRKRGE